MQLGSGLYAMQERSAILTAKSEISAKRDDRISILVVAPWC
jgi:hypothetical protein